MNARIAIFKRDFSLQSLSKMPLCIYSLVVFALLIGITLLQRFVLSPTYASSGSVTPDEKPYVAFAEKICRKLAPDIDQFQVGLVTASLPPKQNKGYVSVQLSDREERHHFHVIVARNTGEVVILSQVVRRPLQDSEESVLSPKKALTVQDQQAERQIALDVARESLNMLCELDAISYREPLGVTVERPGNWTVQWHFRDCCIVMDIRVAERRVAALRLRQHPQPIDRPAKGCPYCLGFGKTPHPMFRRLFEAPLSSQRQ